MKITTSLKRIFANGISKTESLFKELVCYSLDFLEERVGIITVGFPVSVSLLVTTVKDPLEVGVLVPMVTTPNVVAVVVVETVVGAGETVGDGESTRAILLGLLASIKL